MFHIDYKVVQIGKDKDPDHLEPEYIDHPNPELKPCCFVMYACLNGPTKSGQDTRLLQSVRKKEKS